MGLIYHFISYMILSILFMFNTRHLHTSSLNIFITNVENNIKSFVLKKGDFDFNTVS